MQGIRTPAQLLLTAAATAALTGCVAVDGPPPTPAPSPAPAAEPVRPTQDVQPQTVLRGPAREALEAALPSPASAAPPAPRGGTRRATGHAAPPRTPAPEPSPAAERPTARPRPAATPVPPSSAPVPEVREEEPSWEVPPVAGADVCALGERYGGWDPASVQAGLCRDAYPGR
ncbi:hypothetical protein ACFFSH_09330 [Streptomyces filamentosus]|uniref:Lipoprotein n=1 Tax=Streptomyces filamentosus TaxID=67294 RepID=A0A919BS39_STRFL|nr:hypothetical protein [Streptomyces filamentosus]GHG12031.1 hypothetical protein GCM10017667_51630 [Streptomyces filamentosus]